MDVLYDITQLGFCKETLNAYANGIFRVSTFWVENINVRVKWWEESPSFQFPDPDFTRRIWTVLRVKDFIQL